MGCGKFDWDESDGIRPPFYDLKDKSPDVPIVCLIPIFYQTPRTDVPQAPIEHEEEDKDEKPLVWRIRRYDKGKEGDTLKGKRGWFWYRCESYFWQREKGCYWALQKSYPSRGTQKKLLSDAMAANKTKTEWRRKQKTKAVVDEDFIPKEKLIDMSKEKEGSTT